MTFYPRIVSYAFEHLQLKQIIATTTHDNAGSIAVMRKLGMRLKKNPLPTPPWLQIVGLLSNPQGQKDSIQHHKRLSVR